MKLRFDRGTILLENPEDRLAVARLPGVLWDPRVRAFRAPAFQYNGLRGALERSGIRPLDDVAVPASVIGPYGPVDLRPYQEAALDAWEISGRRGLLVLPTGSGKTRVALAAMARAGLTTLCLVPTRVLLDQWCREVSCFYGREVGRLGDGERAIRPVTVSTFESAWRHMHWLGNRFRMLVVDEAHHFGCGVRDEALEMSIADARLGLTATPPEGKALGRLASLIGPVVYELVIADLAGRFLATFDLITVSVELTPAERRIYDADVATFLPFFRRFKKLSPPSGWSDFTRFACRTEEGRRAVNAWRRSRKLLAFPLGKAEALRSLIRRHER